jgi:hypothetical protein
MPRSELRSMVSRRTFLRLGVGGIAAFSSASWLSGVAAHGAATGRKYRSCVLLFMRGGPSHIDTFDPKPDAPAEYRGPFKAMGSSVSGIQVSELFPRVAEQMKHAAIIRGMTHNDAGHAAGRSRSCWDRTSHCKGGNHGRSTRAGTVRTHCGRTDERGPAAVRLFPGVRG